MRCVIDATNLTQRARRTLRHLAGDADRPVIAIVFDVSLERCLSQNDAREGRRVPDSVVHHHHAQMQEALAQLADEGYARVIVLHDADIKPD